MSVVISVILVVIMNVCAYLLGYAKRDLDASKARLKTIRDLKTELDQYTNETFDEKAKNFFVGAHWALNRLEDYEEE